MYAALLDLGYLIAKYLAQISVARSAASRCCFEPTYSQRGIDQVALRMEGGELRRRAVARRNEFLPLEQRLRLLNVGARRQLDAAPRQSFRL